MNRIFSNGTGDFVCNPFSQMLNASMRAHLAAPYFTEAELELCSLHKAAKSGKNIKLLIGLNEITCPQALKKVFGMHGVTIRYFTSQFHAKIFIFDQSALLGSANLTHGGLRANREAVIELNQESDPETLEELRALFVELWEAGEVLTQEKLDLFEKKHSELRKNMPDVETEIEGILGQAQPYNINVKSRKKTRARVFRETLEQEIFERYQPNFTEVTNIIRERSLRHPDLVNIVEFEIVDEYVTNRFLNYVRLTHAAGDTWKFAPVRTLEEERRELITDYAEKWVKADDSKVPNDYIEGLINVNQTFGSSEIIMNADENRIMDGLMSVHSFLNQRRFVENGKLQAKFWTENKLAQVQLTLDYLLHGDGVFIQRFHDVLYDQSWKLKHFGYFCALELFGTVNPHACPPMNERMVKALRFLGFGENRPRNTFS